MITGGGGSQASNGGGGGGGGGGGRLVDPPDPSLATGLNVHKLKCSVHLHCISYRHLLWGRI